MSKTISIHDLLISRLAKEHRISHNWRNWSRDSFEFCGFSGGIGVTARAVENGTITVDEAVAGLAKEFAHFKSSQPNRRS